MGIPAVKCSDCGEWFSPVHTDTHCCELKHLLAQEKELLSRKKAFLNAIIAAHRSYVLGETDHMDELDEAVRAAAEDAGHLWAVREYSVKKE